MILKQFLLSRLAYHFDPRWISRTSPDPLQWSNWVMEERSWQILNGRLVCSVCMEPSSRTGLWPLILVLIQMGTMLGIITLYIHTR